MAGRPWAMARRAESMTSQAYKLAEDFRELMPQQYHDNPDPKDPICMAWRDAMASAAESFRAIAALESLLVVKAIKAEEARTK